MRLIIATLLWALSTAAAAHEMTPTYPEFKMGYMTGVYKTTMTLFNRRDDVKYYEVSVFDADWNRLPFATQSRIIKLDYLERTTFDVYIRQRDVDRVTYICTQSKVTRAEVDATAISSRICSKVRND